MLSKLLFVVTLCNLWLGTNIEVPRSDLIITQSGEKVKGSVQSITGGVIKINTKDGEKTIIRDVDKYSPRDIVEVGVIRTQRHAGNVKYLGTESLIIETISGDLTVNRVLVRKIIISHDINTFLLDL